MTDKNLVLEGVGIIFRNFAGKEGRFNKEGDRNFAVLIDDRTADMLAKDGWNVKKLNPRDEDEAPQAILPVAVSYKFKPPRIVTITSNGRRSLDEDTVEVLDWADIQTVDLTIRPREWEVNGKSGVKAYLKSMFVTIEEDQLELKYSSLDELPARAGRTEMEPPF